MEVVSFFPGSSEERANEEYDNREKSKTRLITRMPFMEDARGREAANFVRAFATSDLFTPR